MSRAMDYATPARSEASDHDLARRVALAIRAYHQACQGDPRLPSIYQHSQPWPNCGWTMCREAGAILGADDARALSLARSGWAALRCEDVEEGR